ncbi:mediator complex, subunit Med21 [Massariosphaeria phaeospora]|uniref:Mediator of RNA polymerase II transcription subunit 21 n=1 Tax=Massariosphaeria phaeospora TaxID=100035 RepID=A0A7C8M709_9PLEO|nr:mediator complex, subunit Med21 [Massariosphaeria phaeospora]
MADILTQLQDELDRLLNQMSASLAYIRENAPQAAIEGQPFHPSVDVQAAQPSQPTQTTAETSQPTQPPTEPPSQEQFRADIKELSRDLIIKEQQIEVLIAALPGLNASEKEQIAQMKELERQLEDIEGERLQAVKEKEILLKRVEDKIGGVGGMR